MPSKPPQTTQAATEILAELGQQIRAHRKSLRVSAAVAAEAAGMSRVTLHRIERGEPSVTMGAYVNAMMALGMNFNVANLPSPPSHEAREKPGWIPARIHLNDYPQLKQLAWQVQGTNALRPAEALDIYERNWRHVEPAAMEPHEQNLIEALRLAFREA